ncbi:hypothetical protein ANCCEY_13610 [Ancylostoma ceylanicum]|uniref:ShKT domain-containing protein n=1 Tax=Ancylostoma ceylanicum TaxID=53326 RepID=A0A0D6LBW1_9BILA|nr:hypothetical protein ANCCEY_13610 [Ancylostoma ceylanicum]
MAFLYHIVIWLFLISQCTGKALRNGKCGLNEWFDECGNHKECERKCNEEENDENEEVQC